MIRTLRPTGAGARSQLTAVGDTPNWNCVEETSSDSDTTYVESVTDGAGTILVKIDSHATADLPTGLLGAISRVSVFMVAKYYQIAPGYAKITPQVRVGTVWYGGTQTSMTGSYATYSKGWTTNPATAAAWLLAAVNAAQIAYTTELLDDGLGTQTAARVTQAYMEVEHVRVFQPTAAASMAMGGPQTAFYHPGPPEQPPKLSAKLKLANNQSVACGLSTHASFKRDLLDANAISGDF